MGAEAGGGAKSLKVVKTLDWLAEVCILSSACAICSLSTWEVVEMELNESRRGLRSLNEEAVVGDRGVLGGFVGSISSFGIPTDAAVVGVLKWRGAWPGVSRTVPHQVSHEGQGNRTTGTIGKQIFMARRSEGSRFMRS